MINNIYETSFILSLIISSRIQAFGTNWITTSEATAYTGLSKTFLYRNRSGLNGDVIPYAKAGKRILYNIGDLDAYLKASGGYRKSNAAAQDSAQTGA